MYDDKKNLFFDYLNPSKSQVDTYAICCQEGQEDSPQLTELHTLNHCMPN